MLLKMKVMYKKNKTYLYTFCIYNTVILYEIYEGHKILGFQRKKFLDYFIYLYFKGIIKINYNSSSEAWGDRKSFSIATVVILATIVKLFSTIPHAI